MSLQDESFPTDELFEQLNSQRAHSKFSEFHQPSAFERDPAPFSDSYTHEADKSANTCVSDPAGRHVAGDEEENENDEYDLHGGRSSKAVSCQDFHSAYTKRKYRHVTSKVAKYISDLNDQKKRGSTSGTSIQRHSSMPEYLTPKSRARNGSGHYSHDELHQMEEVDSSKASKDSSCVLEYENELQNVNEMLRKENDTIRMKADDIQSYSDHIQKLLDAKQGQYVQLKHNFETLRTELSDKDQKLKRLQRNALRSLNDWPPAVMSRATQTEMAEMKSDLKRGVVGGNGLAMPRPSLDLSYNTSEGSIELALPTGESFAGQLSPGNEPPMGTQPVSAAAPNNNNTESSQPTSNDSAIDVENHGPVLPKGLYYIERISRFVEIQDVMLDNHSQGMWRSRHYNISDSQAHLLHQTQSQAHVRFAPRRISLGSRMMRIFGPCVSCSDHDQGQALNASNASGMPLVEQQCIAEIGQRIQR